MNANFELNANPLVQFLNKPKADFTKADIIKIVREFKIRLINFRYAAADGRLKTLNFPVTNLAYIDSILSFGERVDGSSLFPFIPAGNSDLYVIPRFRTAYLDPFAEIPTLGLLCSYFTREGLPLEAAPEYTLQKADKSFREATGGMQFEAMGELEYYLIAPADGLFPVPDQRGYHESAPFVKFESFRMEAMDLIARVGGQIKYGHSEVGNFNLCGRNYEQNEIEFLVNPVEDAAEQLLMAKWILRTLAWKNGIDLTFSPKITVGKAGSGLHFHTRILNSYGESLMLQGGQISEIARCAISGYLDCAPSLTAFGNTNPISYFRLVPHQEAPTNVCWGDSNRSALVRVPLGWTGKTDMLSIANPLEEGLSPKQISRQTVELRSPDGSANIYQMMAGLIVAAREGLTDSEALAKAEKGYMSGDIHSPEGKSRLEAMPQLPGSCWESANVLEKQRCVYEKDGVFAPALIDGVIKSLREFNDKNIREEVASHPARLSELVEKYYHCG